MADLLLELFSEEIPARMQMRAAQDLAELLGQALTEAGLAPAGEIRHYATPRRLTVFVPGLPERQANRSIERKGPRADAPAAAREGFLRSLPAGAFTIEERADKKGGATLFALVQEQGRATRDFLSSLLPELLGRLPWPKSMRWGKGETRWVRPLHAILCTLAGETITFGFAGLRSGPTTRGHRFMAPDVLELRTFETYVPTLRAAKVMLDPAERREVIEQRSKALAVGQGLRLKHDPGLLDELAGLVEWPVPLLGRIDSTFMQLPQEVLVTSMREHQRYLAVEDDQGNLAPFFITVANIEARDGGAAIIAGNERVLRARLWDASFFWEQDRTRRLEQGLSRLENTVFHAELGSQGERVRRLTRLVEALCDHVPGADLALAQRAAQLAKADLVSGMVGEFPELQGIMGGYYALEQGESEPVVRAIAEHYLPKGPEDACPTAPVSVVLALADRLDQLVGFFARGIKPTGSKDPFALRRAALGVIRLVLENGLRLPLRSVIQASLFGYGRQLETVDGKALEEDLLGFFADRLKVHLRNEGVRHDLLTAVFAGSADDDLVRLITKVKALQAFLDTDDGRNLLAGYRRAANIVSIEEKKDKRRFADVPNAELAREPAERRLIESLAAAKLSIERAEALEDFNAAMATVAGLRQPIDNFFQAVMVNVPDPPVRENRLRLLAAIRASLGRIADFSVIGDS
ncbi:glycyl-tRNA synthetase beta chain [Arboricoccus pini]|uniref:Glycine--tRNA ligase beta subunit n=1 Tax=Arboricoccus pini TaxID=1963835 RepID=A0A212QNG5_9PROT|nr:glycine--tRNA ligase subunit beta [Arboricoccus pini]SNB60771.1 glycyl-tRNA synthetase beta chain [Arboricoccus pini]